MNPVSFRRNIAYVMQDDALMATATPREAITFSASMRLPSTTTKEQIQALVDNTLNDLGINDCADVMIGGSLIKGISGGQRKRTSVGIEIVTKPLVCLLQSCILQTTFYLFKVCSDWMCLASVSGRTYFGTGLFLSFQSCKTAKENC